MLRDVLRLQLGDRDARLAACKALAESRSTLAVHFLARAARHDGHVWVRGEATRAPGALGGAKARKAVLEALESADWEVRVAAVSALAGAREVAARAEEDLEHQDWRRRVRAANVLAVVPTADSAPWASRRSRRAWSWP